MGKTQRTSSGQSPFEHGLFVVIMHESTSNVRWYQHGRLICWTVRLAYEKTRGRILPQLHYYWTSAVIDRGNVEWKSQPCWVHVISFYSLAASTVRTHMLDSRSLIQANAGLFAYDGFLWVALSLASRQPLI